MIRKKQLQNHAYQTTGRFPDDFPTELVAEPLRRMSLYDALNCKGVSRDWRSFFPRPGFAEVYNRLKSPGAILISRLGCGGGNFLDQRSFYCSNPQVFFCNICSKQIIRLPDPPGFKEHRSVTCDDYYFGFDPINQVYKLLKISCPFKEYQIIAIGADGSSSSWKKLSPERKFLSSSFRGQGFLANGTLFWKRGYRGDALIAFHLNQEEFRLIRLPDPPKNFTCPLVQFRGRLALFLGPQDNVRLFLLTLEDQRGSEWSRHEVLWPKASPSENDDKNSCDIFPVGNLPTGQILFAKFTSRKSFEPVYAYEHENNTFERFIVGKLPRFLYLIAQPWDDYATVSFVGQYHLPKEALVRGSGATLLWCDCCGG